MKITRRSMLTGKTHTREINVTPHEIERWKSGELIQDACVFCSDADREFLKTGITPEEWDAVFGEEAAMDRAMGG
jgi:hypothetical protein